MTISEVVQRIGEIGIVPVVRAANPEEAGGAVQAVLAGGIPIVEITMTVPNADAVIRDVSRRYGSKVLTGAGTVLSAEQANRCLDAGAQFLVSPGLAPPVLEIARARGVLAIPGALTPTEFATAMQLGATLVKIFPCGNVGGPKYLKALRGPFPNARLIPTGGVNVSNAADYIAAGAFALGVGSDLVDQAAIRAGNSQKVVDTAIALVQAVQGARQSARKTAAP
jgi:2-dehydro-3-deoxyphosphogluconate aldolase/(4S)-4-hydroxy-2-oxoglutarate aldolase